jgi:SAM-dependent methyltransferase
MHAEAEAAMRRMIADSDINRWLEWDALDIGGRYINGSVRHLLRNAKWTGLDIKPGRDVDIVHDAATWLPDRAYEVVMSTEVFEHTPAWRRILATCQAALKPGGYLFVTCASTGRRPHSSEGTPGVPKNEYYANVHVDELRHELERLFSGVHVMYQFPPGDAYAWARRT